ncbi:MAG: WecB/TagA/CpsF family glycosyltransferase [Candidatus Margulisiibacteriota bacterium]
MRTCKAVKLAGIEVDNVTMPEAMDMLERFISSGKPHLIVTPNPEMIVKAQRETEFKQIISTADLRLPDGISMVVVSRILGVPLAERVSGIDFMLRAIKLSAEKGYRIFLLGSKPGVAETAASRLRSQFPGLKIAGTHHGYFDIKQDREIITLINNAKPDILFAGLGHGRQEKWLSDNLMEINVSAAAGIGGSLDVISGNIKRAPVWAQRLYIEWLYRLVTQPWRARRQVALLQFLWLVFRPNFTYNNAKRG